MRRAALTITFAAAVAAMGLAPSWASGAPGTLPDQNFAAGTFASTEVVAPNAVRLTIDGPVIEFETQPDDWLVDAWETGGNATFDGVMTVDGALAYQTSSGTAGQVLEATATFAAVPFQNLGFATDFNAPLWAMFSTGDGGNLPVGLYARTNNGVSVPQNTPIAGVVATERHDYRIEWDTGEVRFFVDGVLVATQAVEYTAELNAAASDLDFDDTPLTVDWLQRGPYTGSGTFTSRILETTDPRTIWGTLTAAPGGPGITFETRTTNNAVSGPWSAWQPLGANGAIQSPPGRYIQYQATFTASDPTVSPLLDGVTISYDIDDVPPRTVISSLDVVLDTATVGFSSPDPDVVRFECSRDGAPLVTCTSPTTFGGLLPGAHFVVVRAVDRFGNVGDPVTRGFTVAAPPLPPPVVTGVSVRIGSGSLRATRRGVVALRVRCVRAEDWCRVNIRLRRGSNTAARRTVTIAEGKVRTVALQLTSRTRRALAGCRTLRMNASLRVRDAAGNRQTARRVLRVTRAGCGGAASLRR